MGSKLIRAVAVVAVGVALAGCQEVGQSRLDFTNTEKAKITEVRISGGSGDVTVRTAKVDQTVLKRVVRYRGDQPGKTYRVEGTVLHIETDCGSQCWVDYDIEAPTGVAVTGQNGSGNLTVTGTGRVDVSVGSGEIDVRDATGPVTARTGSGNINVGYAGGDVQLRTSSGNIEATGLQGAINRADASSGDITLDLDKPATVRAHASSGNVTVTVPVGTAYRVTAQARSGDETIDVQEDPASRYAMEVTTGSGNITIVNG